MEKNQYKHIFIFLQMTISCVDFEPCGRKFREKQHIQSGQPWKQLSLPRLVLLNRWRFNFELLHWCKKKLGESGCFSHITDRSCASDEGDVWNSIPKHLCLHAQDTDTQTQTRCGGWTMLLHQMLKQKISKESVSVWALLWMYSYLMVMSVNILSNPVCLCACMCVIEYTKRGKSWGSCHIKNRVPVSYLMSLCHHPLLLPYISSIMFLIFPQ